MTAQPGLIDYFTSFFIHPVIFSIRFMFTEILHFYRTKCSQACMKGGFCKPDSLYFQPLNEFFTKM